MLKPIFLTSLGVNTTLASITKVIYTGMLSFCDSQAHHRSTAPLIGACRISHRSPLTALMRSSLTPEVGVALVCLFFFIPFYPFPLEIAWRPILAVKKQILLVLECSAAFLKCEFRKTWSTVFFIKFYFAFIGLISADGQTSCFRQDFMST